MSGTEQKRTGPDLAKGVRADSLPPGRKILGHVGESPVLLVNEGGVFYAVGAVCPHYGANLGEGIVVDGAVRCPWHHACFDLKTGEAMKAPALSPIPVFEVELRDGLALVGAPRAATAGEARAARERFVIVGGGAAGHAAAERLRQLGFAGTLTVLSEDLDAPYDRPNLSKAYLSGEAPEEWMPLRPADFYAAQGIDLRLGVKAEKLDPRAKTLTLSTGETLGFDRCLLATGGAPVRPPIPGLGLPHVRFLRSFSDCRALIRGVEGRKRVVIVGAGFIGLEGAAALRARGLEVTVVAPQSLPLEHVVGREVAAFLRGVHEKNGVRFRLGHTVEKIEPGAVVLDGGALEPADLVLVAAGIRPNVALASEAGLLCENGVLVDGRLETSAPGVFAAGDLARWRDPRTGGLWRVEHWAVAQRQGQLAAANMLGANRENRDVPFFWTQQFDVTLHYVGHVERAEKPELFGSLEGRDAAVAFHENGRIGAVLTIGRDQQSLLVEEALERGDQGRIRDILRAWPATGR
jgi:NADPH-dependent 2,4-dienoyl-CoA reductase/sulfur reductase-like enzyme/nitrite reductase/ring-hydroxylating ferredoxin subunit